MSTLVLRLIAVLGILGLLPASVCADEPKPGTIDYEYYIGTQTGGNDGKSSYGMVGGVLVCGGNPRRPIAWFGAIKPGQAESRYLYLIVFKTKPDFKAQNISVYGDGATDSGKGERCRMSITMSGKKIDVEYDFQFDPKTRDLTKETLKVGDIQVKKGEPHVFVVDLTGEKVTYTAVKVDLPKKVPDVSRDERTLWGSTVHEAVVKLKADSAELKKLLEEKK